MTVMKKTKLSLGVDTSNYKTSVAVVAEGGEILFSRQEFLEVKKGERGLRQSEALFQHVNKLPGAIASALSDREIRENIGCIAVSDRPRPEAGSYMPVFNAGVSAAEILSASLAVPIYRFSHQEGHVEAVKYYSEMKEETSFICFHFSGGTTEALAIDKERGFFRIVGGSKDISYGQVLDRIGVAMGFNFPCGKEMDELAVACFSGGCEMKTGPYSGRRLFTPIKVKDGFVNLSGIETQGQRLLESLKNHNKADEMQIKKDVARELLCCIADSVEGMTMQLAEKYDIKKFIFAGGVSSSEYIRNHIEERLAGKVSFVFGEAGLSQDNAVGTALLGGNEIWH